MKKGMKYLLLMVVAALFSSCLQSGIDITVNKDGSGELVQTFMVIRDYMAFMNMGEAAGDPNMINEEQLLNQADAMGEGVKFERVEAADEKGPYAGYKAYYSFDDISKLKTSPTPMTSPGETVDDSDWFTFEFTKGSTSTLVLHTSEENEDDDDDSDEEWESEPPTEEEQAQIEQMKQIYRSMAFWFTINVEGSIESSNALYTENSKITIMDMKFEKIIENDKLFRGLTASESNNLDKMRKDLEKAGVKIDDQERIEISFR